MSDMPEYDGSLENRDNNSQSQPDGVSEDSRNDGWGHRSELSLSDDQKAVSQVVEENREGELEYPNFDEPSESEKHVDNDEKELSESEEQEKKASKYAAKYSQYHD